LTIRSTEYGRSGNHFCVGDSTQLFTTGDAAGLFVSESGERSGEFMADDYLHTANSQTPRRG
jgi:hypothetical protein